MMQEKRCRECQSFLIELVFDLGFSALANSFLDFNKILSNETTYPLRVFFCSNCKLAQIPQVVAPENIFEEYVYFSSWSESWLEHCSSHASEIIAEYAINQDSFVVEIASNDGYMLKNFVEKNIKCLGVEPAKNVAEHAQSLNIPTLNTFFSLNTAHEIVSEYGHADIIIGKNVMAHVPDLNDFVAGISELLSPDGRVILEFPHVMNLVDLCQFDTIYHEHFSYLSLTAVEIALFRHSLIVFDVKEVPTHGGSLRIYGAHKSSRVKKHTRINDLRARELAAGLDKADYYRTLADRARIIKFDLLELLIKLNKQKLRVAAYGAAAKGNTLLNYCGITIDLIQFVVDRNPNKQNKFLPGSHIPIYGIDHLTKFPPDFLLILPWNLKDEIISYVQALPNWHGQFILPIPNVVVIK